MIQSLDRIPIGGKAIIHEITADYVTKERLESLGFIQGVEVQYVRKSPLGNPRIYKCLNTLVALRKEISGEIRVEVPYESK